MAPPHAGARVSVRAEPRRWQPAQAWSPDPRAIDLWWSVLPPARAVDADAGWLSAQERERVARQERAGGRGVFASSRSLLRRVLALYTGRRPDELVLGEDEHGRPRLEAPCAEASLDFNLSHSGALAIVAVGRGVRLGVDLERHRPGRDLPALARRFFAEEEAQALADAGPVAFYDHWVCKEAYLKALGTGLAFGSRRFAIASPADAAPRLLWTEREGDDAGAWRIARVAPPHAEVSAALCWRGGSRRVRGFRQPSPDQG